MLISHNELGHDPVDVTVDGKEVEQCPLYPGMTCRQHCDIAVETGNSRDETLPVVDFVELCPNAWLIRPDNQIDRIPEADQFTAGGVQKAAAAVQKALGKPLSRKTFAAVRPHVQQALAAVEDESWRAALEALAKGLTTAETPPSSLVALAARVMEMIEEEVDYLFEEALEEDTPAVRTAAVKALLQQVDVTVGGKTVPVRDKLAAWLKNWLKK